MNKSIVLLALLATSTVHAESLEETKFWKRQMDYVNKRLETAAKSCDIKFTFTWVDKVQLRDEATKNKWTPNGICTAIVDEVASLCRDGETEKAAVKAKIKGFECGFANPRTLEMKSGIVKYMGNNKESNFTPWAKVWLMKNL